MRHIKSNLWKALALPVVMAESKKAKSEKVEKLMIKPSELPLYDTDDDNKYEYWVSEPSRLEEGIEIARKEVLSLYSGTKYYTDKVVDTYEIGKAHTMTSVNFIQDEENVVARAGLIGVGGLLGLLVGMRKKGLIRKLFYTSIGAGGITAALYPSTSYDISMQGVDQAKNYANIGYNFVVGMKPDEVIKSISLKSETPVASVEKAKEVLAVPVKKETPKKTQIEPDFGQSNPEDSDMYTTRS